MWVTIFRSNYCNSETITVDYMGTMLYLRSPAIIFVKSMNNNFKNEADERVIPDCICNECIPD